MSKNEELVRPVSLEVLLSLDLSEAVEEATAPSLEEFERVFAARAVQASGSKDPLTASGWRLLELVASFVLQPREPDAPLVSIGGLKALRLAGPEDLLDAELDSLRGPLRLGGRP